MDGPDPCTSLGCVEACDGPPSNKVVKTGKSPTYELAMGN